MKKKKVANWERQLKVRKVVKDNAGLPLAKLTKQTLVDHEALLVKVEKLIEAPAGRSEGATLQKSEEEKRAIAAALPVANFMYLWYRANAKDENAADGESMKKAHALRRNKSDYNALPAPLTLAETKNVARQAALLHDQLLSDTEIDEDHLTELDAANLAFSNLMVAPKLAIEEGATTNSAVGLALKAADLFIESDMRPLAKGIAKKFPDFSAALIQAMRIDDAAVIPKKDKPADGGSTPA